MPAYPTSRIPTGEPPPQLLVDPPAAPPGGNAPRRGGSGRRRLAAGVALAVAIGGGVVVVDQVRSADAAAVDAATSQAERDLLREVGAVRASLADPARAGQDVATTLLRDQILAVSGEPVDTDRTEALLGQLRDAADRLDAAAAQPLPDRPVALAVDSADPVYARVDALRSQAADLAERFRTTADDTEAWNAALAEVVAAGTTYAASTEQLPDGDDPDVVADAWRAELDRLDAFRADLDAASDPEAGPSLQPLVDAQLRLADGMTEVAEASIGHLEDGDIDAYDALLDDRLSGSDRFGVSSALADARERIGAQLVGQGSLERSRAFALGLITELDDLRRTAPEQLRGEA